MAFVIFIPNLSSALTFIKLPVSKRTSGSWQGSPGWKAYVEIGGLHSIPLGMCFLSSPWEKLSAGQGVSRVREQDHETKAVQELKAQWRYHRGSEDSVLPVSHSSGGLCSSASHFMVSPVVVAVVYVCEWFGVGESSTVIPKTPSIALSFALLHLHLP